MKWLTPSFYRSKLEGRPNLQNIVVNTGWLFADKVLRLGVGLVVSVWIARYLGPEQFGAFNYATAFVALFGVLASLGLDSIVVRDIVRDPSTTAEVLGSATVLKLAGSIITMAAATATVMVLRPGDPTSVMLVAVISAGTLFQSLDTIDFWFQSQVRMRHTVYARNLAFLLVAAVRVVLITSHAPLVAFAWANILELIVGMMGLVVVYVRDGNSFAMWRFSVREARRLLRESWPLILQGIVIMVYMRIDQVMLGQMASHRSVGVFSAAVRLVEVWYFIPIALTTALFPEIINSKKLSPEKYGKRIQHLYDLMIWMAIGAALIVTFAAPVLVDVLLGRAYAETAQILTLQVWMAAAVFFGVARQKWLMVEGYLKAGLAIEVVAVIMNIGANYILIPRYGALGATFASLVTAFGANIVVACFSRPIRTSMIMYTRSLMLPVRLAWQFFASSSQAP